MWCPNCRAEVSAELALDHRRLLCTQCATELGTAAEAMLKASASLERAAETERDARDLLARWSADNALESLPRTGVDSPVRSTSGPHFGLKAPAASSSTESAQAAPKPRKTRWRIDTSHPASSSATPAAPSDGKSQMDSRSPRQDANESRPRRKRRRPVHPELRPSDLRSRAAKPTRKRGVAGWWMSLIGQVCAYGGVGLLTCGTALVLSSYFGGPEQYAPTGWLMTTIGQMMLFLGVVTLVSGGLEQTTQEVARRIERLGDRLIRIEVAHGAHRLRGPHFALSGSRRRRRASAHSESATRDRDDE